MKPSISMFLQCTYVSASATHSMKGDPTIVGYTFLDMLIFAEITHF